MTMFVIADLLQRKLGDQHSFASCDFDHGICAASFVALANANNKRWQVGAVSE